MLDVADFRNLLGSHPELAAAIETEASDRMGPRAEPA
jgi:hypothetical protein